MQEPHSTPARSRPTDRSLLLWSAGLTVAFELLTCVLRFGLKLQSTRDTASTIGRLTCGIRIHHSYVGGAMMVIAAMVWDRYPRAAWWSLAVGLGLFFSDMIHHFLVLWPIEGSPQFHLTYPPVQSP